jgi:Flp pilus assembly pilin Flp
MEAHTARRWACMALPGWIDRIRSRCRPEKAQTMAEYAVVLGVITPAIILAYGLFADQIAALFDSFRSFFP